MNDNGVKLGTFMSGRYVVSESLIQAGVGAGIGAVFSAKDIYEVRAPRTRKNKFNFIVRDHVILNC